MAIYGVVVIFGARRASVSSGNLSNDARTRVSERHAKIQSKPAIPKKILSDSTDPNKV